MDPNCFQCGSRFGSHIFGQCGSRFGLESIRIPDPGFDYQKLSKRLKTYDSYFLTKKCNIFISKLPQRTSKLQEKPPVQSWSWSSRPKSMWIHAGLDELLQINTKINLVYLSASRQVVSCITTSLSSSVFIKTCAVSIFVWKQYNNFHIILEEARRDNNIKWCTPCHSSNDICLNFIKKINKRNKSIIICTDPSSSKKSKKILDFFFWPSLF